MKALLFTALFLSSFTVFASSEVDSKLVQEIQGIKANPCNCDGASFGSIYLKQGSTKADLTSSKIKIEGDKLVVVIDGQAKELASFDSNKIELAQKVISGEASGKNIPADLLTSKENISAKIITNNVNRTFKMMLCSHIGCIPYPHTEETYRKVIELKTLDGEAICFKSETNRGTEITLGSCQE